LLPPNASAQERSLSETIARAFDVNVPLRPLWDPDACPEELLPWLAWALSVDTWDSAWPLDTKREVVRRSLAIHRRKGTPWAVEQALAAMGLPAQVSEWWEYGGEPHHFAVDVEAGGVEITEQLRDQVERAVQAYKNVRSWLDAIRLYYVARLELRRGMGGAGVISGAAACDTLVQGQVAAMLRRGAGGSGQCRGAAACDINVTGKATAALARGAGGCGLVRGAALQAN
jgi:phage tail P2-like protein